VDVITFIVVVNYSIHRMNAAMIDEDDRNRVHSLLRQDDAQTYVRIDYLETLWSLCVRISVTPGRPLAINYY
jgi:hypothetical protein